MVDVSQKEYASLATAEDFELVALSRSGIKVKDFLAIADESGFSLEDWATWLRIDLSELLIPSNEEHFLKPHQSERVLDINRLLYHGISALGNPDMLVKWFNHSSIPLGGIAPKSLLDNTFGIDMVHAELGRIEHGVLA
ncbi:MAG: antitoxin Xre/MbcA/ParS toxin-binding domain-containing protein [Saprospiraceae bacterium]